MGMLEDPRPLICSILGTRTGRNAWKGALTEITIIKEQEPILLYVLFQRICLLKVDAAV